MCVIRQLLPQQYWPKYTRLQQAATVYNPEAMNANLEAQAGRWNVSMNEAAVWAAKIEEDTHIAIAMHVVLSIDAVRGLLVLMSTARSCAVSRENQITLDGGSDITDPHWLYWDVFWYPNVALFKLFAVSQSRRAQTGIGHTLGKMIKAHFLAKGMRN